MKSLIYISEFFPILYITEHTRYGNYKNEFLLYIVEIEIKA